MVFVGESMIPIPQQEEWHQKTFPPLAAHYQHISNTY